MCVYVYLLIVAKVYHNSYFGKGTGPIFLSRVNCAGTEANLTDCVHSQEVACTHSRDAGVQCLAQGNVYCLSL